MMKKTKRIRIFTFLLCLLLLVSCQSGEQSVSSTVGSTQDSTQQYVPPTDELLLAVDGQAHCALICSKDADEALQEKCVEIAKAVRSATGAGVKRYTDTSNAPEGTVEILIGDTNRQESAQAKSALKKFSYSISVINGKVVVVGSDKVMLENAIQKLIDMLPASAENTENAVWTISKTYAKTVDCTNYLYNEYIGRGVALTTEHTLQTKMSPIGATAPAGYRYRWVQGGCTDGTYYYYFMVTDYDTQPPKCVALKYDLATQKLVKVSGEMELDHANGAVYNPYTKKLVVAHGGGTIHVSIIDPETLKIEKTFDLSEWYGVVSYDQNKRQYLFAQEKYIDFYDESFKKVKRMEIKGMLSEFEPNGGMTRQGMTSDDKFIYYMEYWQNRSDSKDIHCNIVVYDINTCEFIQRIPLYMKREVENIAIWDNCFYIVCNNITWTGAECYRVKVLPLE